MADDHLDKETSVSVELTETGIKAGSKSRFVAAVDRLAGGVVDLLNAHIEAPAERRRAKTGGEVKLIEAAAQYGVEMLGADPATAERAFHKHFRKVIREQENSEAVAKEALEDLRANPPSEEANQDNTPLSEEFLDRMETYSASATTDDLRKRWGRVLAAEVRSPGTFNGKVLRVIDELNSDTALQFEEVVKHRIGSILPKALVGQLAYDVRTNLVLADLLVDPGIAGQVRYYSATKDSAGLDLQMAAFPGVGAVSFPCAATISADSGDEAALTFDASRPGIPCFVLTDVALAIASILPNAQFDALQRYATKLAESPQLEWVRLYVPTGDAFRMIFQLPGPKPPAAEN